LIDDLAVETGVRVRIVAADPNRSAPLALVDVVSGRKATISRGWFKSSSYASAAQQQQQQWAQEPLWRAAQRLGMGSAVQHALATTVAQAAGGLAAHSQRTCQPRRVLDGLCAASAVVTPFLAFYGSRRARYAALTVCEHINTISPRRLLS
jgi:hypothetical protein